MPRPQKRSFLPFIIFAFIIILLIGAFAAVHYMPSSRTISYRTAMELSSRGYFIVGGEPLGHINAPEIKNDILYVPVDFVKAQLDKYIFWDDKADRLSITTENRVIRMSTDNLDYYINHEPMRLNLPVYAIGGQAYLPAEFLEDFYGVQFDYIPDTSFAIVTMPGEGFSTALTSKKASLRFEPDIKSPILKPIAKGTVIVLRESYDKTAKFIKIQTADGTAGFIPSGVIGEVTHTDPKPLSPPETPLHLKKPIEGRITMLWDQINVYEDNSRPEKFLKYSGLDVLSPTWFSFNEQSDGTINGDIINIAEKSYVEWAHENGYQVWAVLTDNFNSNISHAVLANTEKREYVIKQLLAFTSMYNLDGINIDFEKVRVDDADYYLQFLRELGPLLREQGASLSVDMFVPTYTKHYNRTEVAKVVDYICVMAYDEHYSGSETSGPVASLPFVDRGIMDTLLEVPKEKIIMGMPFYVRVWRELEENGKPVHTIRNLMMDAAYRVFVENGAKFTWLPDIGSYYAEYSVEEDGKDVTYRVWLEDLRSIQEKLDMASYYEIAGVAGWRRGLESAETWDAIATWRSEGH